MKNYPRPLSFSRGGPLTKFFRPFDSCWCTIILDYHKITITRLPLSLDGNKLKESMQSLSGQLAGSCWCNFAFNLSKNNCTGKWRHLLENLYVPDRIQHSAEPHHSSLAPQIYIVSPSPQTSMHQSTALYVFTFLGELLNQSLSFFMPVLLPSR